jgi:hypothetical protein
MIWTPIFGRDQDSFGAAGHSARRAARHASMPSLDNLARL